MKYFFKVNLVFMSPFPWATRLWSIKPREKLLALISVFLLTRGQYGITVRHGKGQFVF